MGEMFGVIAVSAGIAVFEIPPLVRKKLIREALIILSLLMIGSFISVMQILEKHVPNPLNGLTAILQPISMAIFKLMT